MTMQTHQGRASRPEPWWLRLAFLSAALAVLVPPVVVLPQLDDAFALPKLMVAEVLALLTVLCLAPGLASFDRSTVAQLLKPRVVRAVLPFLLVATVGLAVTSHTAHTGSALVDMWIAAAFLVGCTVGLPVGRLRQLVDLVAIPALLLGNPGYPPVPRPDSAVSVRSWRRHRTAESDVARRCHW